MAKLVAKPTEVAEILLKEFDMEIPRGSHKAIITLDFHEHSSTVETQQLICNKKK